MNLGFSFCLQYKYVITTRTFSFTSTKRKSAYEIANQILNELYNYCVSNRLIINFTKCCFIEFGSGSLDLNEKFYLGILNNQFEKVDKCKFLGVY